MKLREMKQSQGSLSVDRSFRAQSINTNLYRTLLLPLFLSVLPSLPAWTLTPQAAYNHTYTLTHSASSWCLKQVNPIFPQREGLALSISVPRRGGEEKSVHRDHISQIQYIPLAQSSMQDFELHAQLGLTNALHAKSSLYTKYCIHTFGFCSNYREYYDMPV